MAVAKKVEVEKRSVVVPPGRLKLMETAHNHWCLHAPDGAPPDDVKKGDFWSLCSERFRPFDFITVIANDGTWLVEAIVLSCARTWAQVHVRKTEKFADAVAPESSRAYKAEWKGPELKWCVIRESDKAMVQDGLDNAKAANAWLAEHERRVG